MSNRELVIEPMPGVTRERVGNLTTVVPPLDQSWHWHKKLSWLLGSVLDDCGLHLQLIRFPTNWCITGAGTSMSANPRRGSEFDDLWLRVNDISAGFSMAKRRFESSRAGEQP